MDIKAIFEQAALKQLLLTTASRATTVRATVVRKNDVITVVMSVQEAVSVQEWLKRKRILKLNLTVPNFFFSGFG